MANSDEGSSSSCLLSSSIMYGGPLSFINVSDGREDADDGDPHCIRNVVEAAVVFQLTRSLIQGKKKTQGILSISIISPYDSQVALIQDKLGMFSYNNSVILKVQTVERFQEDDGNAACDDLIIFSTVRSNDTGLIGEVLSCSKKADFILKRTCHCLWIVGSSSTLIKSGSAWEAVVRDTQDRRCFFNAHEDELLSKSIVKIMEDLNQMDSLLDKDSVIFRTLRWTVVFSDKFKTKFMTIKSCYSKGEVLYFLFKLAGGWRPRNYNTVADESSVQIIKKYRVGGMYVVCTVDLMMNLECTQVLKVWDFCHLFEIPSLVKRLGEIFQLHTKEYVNRCNLKQLEGKLEVPISWKNGVKQFKTGDPHYESSGVSESLLLIKFYSLSSDVVHHLLTGGDGSELHLPFEVTDQERELIMYPKSAFILGRSGTGKTTILTTKLIQREQLYYLSLEGLYNPIVCSSRVRSENRILRQLVLTVNSRLSSAIKNHVSCMMSFTHGDEYKVSSSGNLYMCNRDDSIGEYSDIPDSFTRLHPRYFPLVISFWKFLVMLDGSVVNSFFGRFEELKGILSDERGLWSSTVFHAFIRQKKVSYEHFSSNYWRHFDVNLTRKLEPSLVFKEIVCHIKGRDCCGQLGGSFLSRDEYISLSEARVSTLSSTLRGWVYDIFLAYENKKLKKGDFDLSDLVNDIHHRFCEGSAYAGVQMDFVYIDEIQDLTMKQISLLKYVCPNHKDGFVFAGDTAQTIASGNDFRFEDLKALFYTQFQSKSMIENKQHAADIFSPQLFNLTQNFRTHSGILKLAQSVVDLVYCFFPFTVDRLPPEHSFVGGELPSIIHSSDDNAIATIFQDSGHLNETTSSISNGFGAGQVILVRDDKTRHEITMLIGKKAIVLTVLESKGLEFQDVFLYNFFYSSPLRSQWRVIYNYMHTHSLLDSTQFPSFDVNKHSLLCSELKLLYVAITRTRQRLWICDATIGDDSKPMFDYWNKLHLVRTMELKEFLVQTNQVANSELEWKNCGVKLFSEGNYEMAAVSFDRAGDVYWGRWAKAAHLRASGSRILQTNFENGSKSINKAAEMYEEIKKYSMSAQCYIEIKCFKKAGLIYMKKFDDSRLEEAGDCFMEAQCWNLASQAYNKANKFSKCLSVCSKARLFPYGFHCIERWKIECCDCDFNADRDFIASFLEKCVLYGLDDRKNVLRFVKSFSCSEDMRNFLLSRDYMNALIDIESQIGTKIDPNMLQEAGLCEEASSYVLFQVLLYSLWDQNTEGSTGWPLTDFNRKEALLKRAKSLAKKSSSYLYDRVCLEACVLCNHSGDYSGNRLLDLIMHFNHAIELDHFISVFITARKILDIHLHSEICSFRREENPEFEAYDSHLMISEGRMSSSSLMFIWNYCKEMVIDVLGYLRLISEKSQDMVDSKNCERFCYEFLGVRKINDQKCAVRNCYAHWMKNVDHSFFHEIDDYVIMEIQQFASLSIIYWTEVLFYLGMEVVDKLRSLHIHSAKNLSSQVYTERELADLIYISEVLKSIKDLDYHDPKNSMISQLNFLKHSFFFIVFPVDWRRTATKKMFLLRNSKNSLELYREILLENMVIVKNHKKMRFGQIGRIAMLMFGTCSGVNQMAYLDTFLCPEWKVVINQLNTLDILSISQQICLVENLSVGLRTMFYVDFKVEVDYVTPQCFVYLVDRLVIFASSFQRSYYSTRSSILEVMMNPNQHQCLFNNLSRSSSFSAESFSCMHKTFNFVVYMIMQLMGSVNLTKDWIERLSNNQNSSIQLPISKLFIMIGLIYLNSDMEDFVYDYLKYFIRLYKSDYDLLTKFGRCFGDGLEVKNFKDNFATALDEFGDPLVMIDHEKKSDDVLLHSSLKFCSKQIVINLSCLNEKDTMLDQLFQKNQLSSSYGTDDSSTI